MFSKLKLYIVLGVITVGLGISVSLYLDNHSFVSDRFIKQKTDSIRNQKREILIKDSLLFLCQQTVDMNYQLATERQIVLFDLKKQLKQAENEAKVANEAIGHYEKAGLMRYFIKPFISRCYEEVFEKPDCVKMREK